MNEKNGPNKGSHHSWSGSHVEWVREAGSILKVLKKIIAYFFVKILNLFLPVIIFHVNRDIKWQVSPVFNYGTGIRKHTSYSTVFSTNLKLNKS